MDDDYVGDSEEEAPLDDEVVEEESSSDDVVEEEAPLETDVVADDDGPLPEPRAKLAAAGRIQQEIARRKAVEAELAEYRRHVLDMQRQTAAPRPQGPDPEEERRRLEFMDEGQRVEYLVNKGLHTQKADLHRLELQMHIQNDKAEFNTFAAANPQFKKYTNDVETCFQDSLNQGQPRSRREILTNLVGADVIGKGASVVAKARQTGAENIRKQATRPSTVRSGVSSTSGRGGLSAEETLKRRLAGGEYS